MSLGMGDTLNFYCYLSSFISMKELSRMLGIPIYIRGPHTEEKLKLQELYDFGFYHPEFPIRIRRYLLPAVNNSTFRSLTQKNYDSYIKNLARHYFVVYRKLKSNPVFFEKEADRYYQLVKKNRLEPFYLERFLLFMHPDFTDGESIEDSAKFSTFPKDEEFEFALIKQVVGFWIRRNIDKTDTLFYLGLVDLISTYDNDFYESRIQLKQ